MPNLSFAELISRGRAAKGWSRKQLADATGYSAVMIAKIESGERVPDEQRIPGLAQALGIDVYELKQAASRSDRRKSGAPKIVDGMKLAKQNGERANRLKARAEHLKRDADRTAKQLDEKVREFDLAVVGPFSALLSRVADIPEDAMVHATVEPHQPNPEFSTSFKTAQLKTSKSIYALMGAGVLGDGAGAPIGGGAPTATLVTVASIATVSVGAAISGLADVASRSARAATIARLAAPVLGVAAGTGVITGIVVLPVVAAAAGAALGSGGRLLAKQMLIQKQIEDAESDFDENAQVVQKFVSRASNISEILTVAVLASRHHTRTIENAVPEDREIGWPALDVTAQGSMRRMAEIMLACLTVIGLPIGLNLAQAAPEDALNADVVDEGSVPQIEPALGVGLDLENEFIDYVIEEAFAQVAR